MPHWRGGYVDAKAIRIRTLLTAAASGESPKRGRTSSQARPCRRTMCSTGSGLRPTVRSGGGPVKPGSSRAGRPGQDGRPSAGCASTPAAARTPRTPIVLSTRPTLRLPFAALALAIGLALLLPVTAFAWGSNAFSSTSEQQLFQLTNQARAAAGRKALHWDARLATLARARAKDMIVRNYFAHQIPPDGHTVFDVMSNVGYCFNLAGENIGWNNYPDDQ